MRPPATSMSATAGEAILSCHLGRPPFVHVGSFAIVTELARPTFASPLAGRLWMLIFPGLSLPIGFSEPRLLAASRASWESASARPASRNAGLALDESSGTSGAAIAVVAGIAAAGRMVASAVTLTAVPAAMATAAVYDTTHLTYGQTAVISFGVVLAYFRLCVPPCA